MRHSCALLAGVLVTLCIFSSCAGAPHEAPEAARREPVSVRVETLARASSAASTAVVGTVEARRTVTVASKIMAYIKRITVDEGSAVDAGQTLVTLDDDELKTAAAGAEAMKAEAEGAIAAADQAIASAQAQLDLAQATFKRYQDLLAKDSVAKQEFDEAQARLRLAQAGVEQAQASKAQAQARRSQAEAQIAQARTMLTYATIAAPASGVVTKRMADPGSLAAPGAPLLEIELGPYRLEVAVPESQVGALRVGQTLPIQIEALGKSGPSSGRIVEIRPTANPGSRTSTVKIGVSGAGIRSGLYGRAFLPGDEHDILTVPASAVVERGQLRSVFVVEDDIARRRLVTLGDSVDNRVAVFSGLEPGAKVIVDPSQVEDGAPVQPREAP